MTADAITQDTADHPARRAAPPSAGTPRKRGWLGRNRDLLVQPLLIVLLVVFVTIYALTRNFGQVELNAIAPEVLADATLDHLILVGWSTVIVVALAIPLGIGLSRDVFRKVQGPVITFGGFMQALPPLGVIFLIGFWLGLDRTSAVIALVLASFLPVFTNTVVGLRQVEPAMIEAARGMGMSAGRTLLRVELPLAIPVMVAGIRVALVLNVGTATLAVFIGGGGLGGPIFSMYQLARFEAMVVPAAVVTVLALLIDWLAGLAERFVAGRST